MVLRFTGENFQLCVINTRLLTFFNKLKGKAKIDVARSKSRVDCYRLSKSNNRFFTSLRTHFPFPPSLTISDPTITNSGFSSKQRQRDMEKESDFFTADGEKKLNLLLIFLHSHGWEFEFPVSSALDIVNNPKSEND
ncbi:hypothetical protein LXL04_007713 [Taraxacum kok-saghyz]